MKLVIGNKVSESKKNSPTESFKMRVDTDDLDKLRIIRQWYRSQLNLKVSLAMLVRTAVAQFAEDEVVKIEKAKAGRLHAKLRKNQNQNT